MKFKIGDKVRSLISNSEYIIDNITTSGSKFKLHFEGSEPVQWWPTEWFTLAEQPEVEKVQSNTTIQRPPHYEALVLDPLTIAAMYELPPCLTHALKYLLRAGHKGDKVEDLNKGIRCIHMEIEHMVRKDRIACGEDPNEVWKTKL